MTHQPRKVIPMFPRRHRLRPTVPSLRHLAEGLVLAGALILLLHLALG
jgi:hypothetical protein